MDFVNISLTLPSLPSNEYMKESLLLYYELNVVTGIVTEIQN